MYFTCFFISYYILKIHTYYFFDDITDIKDFDPNNIRIDEKLYRDILIYYIGYLTIKKPKKICSVNALYLIFGNVNESFEEINENNYLTLVPNNESEEKVKKYE